MGCDIHLYVENLALINGEPKWVNVDKWTYNPYYKKNNGEPKMFISSIYDRRDYVLFSLLADVRNDYGIKPIFTPRGLPNDISKITKAESDLWGFDGHSHSYFTVDELFELYHEYYRQGECYESTLKSLNELLDALVNFIATQECIGNCGTVRKRVLAKSFATEYRIVFWFDN